ncbi:hypothetical protein A3A40_02355 [Candidatus Kaiserbacteria bacterium RIFCSPLOWO2_01_FULL_54_20]|uniref:Uncharacterized protein n=1 Tax=Candidatus Kaiserbacteria bacterium RIFCSPLOWO2_01_FULL_54_20 TaxID=1798513 RepID=A0A1F6EJN2_9BACT|nr:MAG: hypothetical protein A3A40_02355 [Candidatus Kaiserbacteria bacterium RIFCSPLOWO2_01_FULL_54_20]
MYDYHVVLGIVAVLLAFTGYGLYFRSLFKDGTKPHPFTWFLFAVVDGTVFIAQVWNGGGPGAWATGAGTLLSSVVFLLALQRGEKRITRVDWACLVIVLVGIVGWVATSNALLAVALASACDAIAKVPTFRKSYLRPYEESLSVWSVDLIRFTLSIAALSSITWTTALFPAEVVLTNGILVLAVLLRRRQFAIRAKTG